PHISPNVVNNPLTKVTCLNSRTFSERLQCSIPQREISHLQHGGDGVICAPNLTVRKAGGHFLCRTRFGCPSPQGHPLRVPAVAGTPMGIRDMMNMMTAGASPAIADDLSDGFTRIGDVARQFGVTLRALRFYEDKGL